MAKSYLVRMDEPLYERVKAAAEASNTSMNKFVCAALEGVVTLADPKDITGQYLAMNNAIRSTYTSSFTSSSGLDSTNLADAVRRLSGKEEEDG